MKLNGRAVIWPRYLDASEPRSAGRRLPRRLCVERPKLEELTIVARGLGLNPETRETAAYPRRSRERSGYLVVDKRGSKTEVLLLLADALAKRRAEAVKPR